MESERKIRLDQIGVSDRSVGRLQRAFRFAKDVGLSGVIKLVQKHGLRESCRFLARNIRFAMAIQADKRFDRKHGVDTGGSIQLDSLSVTGPNRDAGNEYVSTSAKSFAWMMQALPGNLAHYTFIDVGAGKGRTLFLASQQQFPRIIGVEFAHELVEIAKGNIAKFRGTAQAQTIEIIEADATKFDFPQDPLVVYFYNPFHLRLFSEVVRSLIANLKSNPRDCFLIYATTMDNISDVRTIVLGSHAFQEVSSRPMPLFWDAVRSIHYAVFQFRGSNDR